VLLASAEEMESHEHALLDIAKASGRPSVWQCLRERGLPVNASA
jgi:hypothetical protein